MCIRDRSDTNAIVDDLSSCFLEGRALSDCSRCPVLDRLPIDTSKSPRLTARPYSVSYTHLDVYKRQVLTLLVADLDAEVHRLVDDGASICVDAAATARLSGSTRSSYVVDPEGNVVELLECSPGRGWGFAACTVVGAQATFLHLQLNTYHYEATSEFYAGFGFVPDPLSEGRPNVDYLSLIHI